MEAFRNEEEAGRAHRQREDTRNNLLTARDAKSGKTLHQNMLTEMESLYNCHDN
jgi:hypothetical protein